MVIVDCSIISEEKTSPHSDSVSLKSESKKSSSHMEDSDASTLSAADEKAKIQQQNKQLESWLDEHGNNLYPSRPDKEKMAVELGTTLQHVTRWFANRRRKQSKRPKPSPSAEDRSRHIQDIVDEVVLRTTCGESFASLPAAAATAGLTTVDNGDDVDDKAEESKENNNNDDDSGKPPMAEMQKALDDIWIKALKNALSSTSWLQQTQQQQQQQPVQEESNAEKCDSEDSSKEMVVNVSSSPVSSFISVDACAGKDKAVMMRPQAEQHHGFVTPPPSVLPRIDSASSLVGGTPTSGGYHQVPDLHHGGSPILTPDNPLFAQNDIAQMLVNHQYQQWMMQMINPVMMQQQYQQQMQILALQQQQQEQQQKMHQHQQQQQFNPSPQTSSSSASPFHVMPTTSHHHHHEVHVDIEASPPTPESFPGDIDSLCEDGGDMLMDYEQEQQQQSESDEEIMSRITKTGVLNEKEALAVLVLAGLSQQ